MNTPRFHASAGKPIVQLDDASASYNGLRILHAINLTIMPGETVAILGRNGAGKTTLLHALFNMGPALGGDILVKDQSIIRWPTYRIARLGMALVPQGRGVFHTLAVHESLRLATLANPPRDTALWSLERIYAEFPRLFERRYSSCAALSGGERQMLALARALLTQPEIIVLDEPSEGLAPLTIDEMLVEKLRFLTSEGITLLLAEQNVLMALKVACRAVVLSAGRIVFDGSPQDLLNDQALHQQHLGI